MSKQLLNCEDDKMVTRGDIWMVKFDGIGSEQHGLRPALV